jgi:hypothetical protein
LSRFIGKTYIVKIKLHERLIVETYRIQREKQARKRRESKPKENIEEIEGDKWTILTLTSPYSDTSISLDNEECTLIRVAV